MIAAVREWLTSIVVVTLLISVAQTLITGGTLRKVASFTGGLILLAALLQPLLGTDLEKLNLNLEDYESAIEERRQELADARQAALEAEIAEDTALCIEKKAAEIGLTVEARVKTNPAADGTPVPWAATLEGIYDASLSSWIASELDIPGQRQIWHTVP